MAALFSLLDCGTAIFAEQFGPSDGSEPAANFWDPYYSPPWVPDPRILGPPTLPKPEDNTPTPPASEAAPALPTPPYKVPPANPPSPPSLALAPSGRMMPTTPTIGGNSDDGQQGGSQKAKRSKPNVGATLGWVFLAAAALLQVALGGFLAYKRSEVMRYGVRMEQVPADASPSASTAFGLCSDRLP